MKNKTKGTRQKTQEYASALYCSDAAVMIRLHLVSAACTLTCAVSTLFSDTRANSKTRVDRRCTKTLSPFCILHTPQLTADLTCWQHVLPTAAYVHLLSLHERRQASHHTWYSCAQPHLASMIRIRAQHEMCRRKTSATLVLRLRRQRFPLLYQVASQACALRVTKRDRMVFAHAD